MKIKILTTLHRRKTKDKYQNLVPLKMSEQNIDLVKSKLFPILVS